MLNNKQLARFWNSVAKTEGCWWWTRETRGGYGRFFAGRKMSAHVISFVLAGGTIPDGMCLMHSCDNPSCVNPSHLSVGTQRDNVHDCVRKGRHSLGDRTGERHPLSQLTNRQALHIRRIYSGERGQITRIARRLNVSRKVVSRIIHGESYQIAKKA